MTDIVRRIPWPGKATQEQLLDREWIVTNGLGGYASGTVAGVITRRFHGLLVAALPSPYGRRMMLNDVAETLRFGDGTEIQLGGQHLEPTYVRVFGAEYLEEFRLESGLPVWTWLVRDIRIEKRVVLPYRHNTVHVQYRVSCGSCDVRLELRPALHFRPHEGVLGTIGDEPYTVRVTGERYEFSGSTADTPPLRVRIHGAEAAFTFDRRYIGEQIYHTEESRGYESRGRMWSPGYFHVRLTNECDATLVASTESWEITDAIRPAQAFQAELERRSRLISTAHRQAQSGLGAELVLAADQFVITPVGRAQDVARAHASGDEVRTVIAGYHWFTDWGRDTMISLEGLTLATGRYREAGWILRTFAYYVRDGLIPNMFPEGETVGL
ncbi:MAG TPA: glycogen debranching enzyme N-terminal domain-containing protein, partial [Bryobacteraceae bacterium]|nr:glycogen debranching enzyme N-terminal domain-containing protein [Bryobacteraceae bacterium]